MIFGKSPLLAAILGGNGKEELLQQEEARARKAQDRLHVAVAESSKATCEAVENATEILGAVESDFDIDLARLHADQVLSCPPTRLQDDDDEDLEAA